ncbi:MAG TPA: Ku protein [Cytophagales bacterium]|nr:Ku protein [Cytophagales bacterium]
MRAIWTGAIGFGLVNIPVKIFSATQDSNIDLDMLDKRDHSNIKFQRVNATTGDEVSYEDIVKGYKVDDEYVILEDEDFVAANAKKTKTIEILEFVMEEEIDSIYFENPYYLEPDKSGARAYALLREALKSSKKIGVSSFVMRNKESLAVIKPMDDVLVLNKIRFQEEIRSTEELDLPPVAKLVKDGEMKMALLLIDQLTKPFDISQYKDTYKEELLKVIEAKSKGKKVKTVPIRAGAKGTKDLMAQLKASLESRKAS